MMLVVHNVVHHVKSATWKMKMMSDCVRCSIPMWTEGVIADNIPLCHACYLWIYENKKEKEYVNVL